MAEPQSDTAAEFRRLIEALWGYGAQGKAAAYFEVADRTVRHWLAGARAVPERVMTELRQMVQLAPPPDTTSEQDRDEACCEAIEPAMRELRDRACAAGWDHSEVAVAMFDLAFGEIQTAFGDDAARDVLDQASALLTTKS